MSHKNPSRVESEAVNSGTDLRLPCVCACFLLALGWRHGLLGTWGPEVSAPRVRAVAAVGIQLWILLTPVPASLGCPARHTLVLPCSGQAEPGLLVPACVCR